MIRLVVFVAQFLVIFAAGAFVSTPGVFAQRSRTKVGVIAPLTGAFAQYGAKIRAAVEQSAKELPIDLIFEDEGCDPAMALRAYRRLADVEGVQLFLGPWCGSPQRVLAPQIASHRQLAILSSSAPESIYSTSKNRMFSMQYSIESESRENAKRIFELGHRRVAILFAENDFSRAHEEAFRKEFGGGVVDTLTYAPNANSDIRPLVTRLRSLDVDALYVPDAFPLMGNLLREVRGSGLGKLPVFSVYSAQSEDVLEAVGHYGEGLQYSYPDITAGDAFEEFARRAVVVLGQAMAGCEVDDIECVRNNLMTKNAFDAHGTLPGKIVQKSIRNGQFQ
jgi:ABC-type branched-subunit amino acid transport system substrate-binding protein